MSESNWTTTPPTAPGWYWTCQHWARGISTQITRVGWDDDDGKLRAWDVYSFVSLDSFFLWSDEPISLPKFCQFDTSAIPMV